MQVTDHPAVSLETAQHILHHFGDTNLGLQPGSFTHRLMTTISAADESNRTRLAEGFPELVYAFDVVQREPWGLEWLRSRVKRGRGFTGEPNLFEELAS